MDLMRIYQEMLLLWRLLTKSIVGYFSSTEKIDIYCRIWKGWLCNAIIQPHFHDACSAWYPNLNKKFKSKLKTIQNKCIRFCLQLNIRSHIGIKESEQITGSLFTKGLINAFVLILLNFLMTIVLYIYMIYLNHLDKIK